MIPPVKQCKACWSLTKPINLVDTFVAVLAVLNLQIGNNHLIWLELWYAQAFY